MIISHNILAMNANRQFNIINKNKAKSTEKLSSGYRINRAADDAAGLSISEKMRWQIRGLNQGARNTQDGVSVCQVADGALGEVSAMLHRITELAVQSANGTYTDEDREAIQHEIAQIMQEIDRIGDTTEFNTKKLFGGSIIKEDNNSSSIPVMPPQVMTPANIVGNTVISGGIVDIGTITTPELFIKTQDVVQLTGKNSNLTIKCDEGISLILDDLEMDKVTDTAIDFQGSGNIVKLVGQTYIDSVNFYDPPNTKALVHIGSGTTVTFEGDGVLGVNQFGYNNNAAAIGGNANENGGNIIINCIQPKYNYKGNLVGINDYGGGAGIGGGINADGGMLEVNSGSVYGTGARGAGIGGGENGNGGNVILNGGELYALIGHTNGIKPTGAAIGGGENGNGGTMTYNGGTLKVDKLVASDITSAQGIGAGSGGSTSGNFVNNTNNVIVPTNQAIFAQAPDINSNTSGTGNSNQNIVPGGAVNHIDGKWWIQSGSEAGQGMWLEIDPMNTSILGINNLDVSTVDGANHAIDAVQGALDIVSSSRSKIGAQQNRLEHTISNNQNNSENTTAAESRIRDTDIADEMVKFSKESILENVGQAMLAQSNQFSQNVLSLLQ